jgi:uncharacterized protein with WD repeat
MELKNSLGENISKEEIVQFFGLPLDEIIFLRGTPSLAPDRVEKFRGVFDRILNSLVDSKLIKNKDSIKVCIPLNAEGGNDGYILLGLNKEHTKLKDFFDNYQLDSKHKFSASYLFDLVKQFDTSKILLKDKELDDEDSDEDSNEETERGLDHIMDTIDNLSFVKAGRFTLKKTGKKTIMNTNQETANLKTIFDNQIMIKDMCKKHEGLFKTFDLDQYANSDKFFNFYNQFAVHLNNTSEINWFHSPEILLDNPNDSSDKKRSQASLDLVVKQENWTENQIGWSPKGTFFYTTHSRGIKIWIEPENYYDESDDIAVGMGTSGSQIQNVDITNKTKNEISSKTQYVLNQKMESVQTIRLRKWIEFKKFEHSSVDYLEFSPCERFLLTRFSDSTEKSSLLGIINKRDKKIKGVKIWDIKTGALLKEFKDDEEEKQTQNPSNQHLIMKSDNQMKGAHTASFEWSHDGSYLAHYVDKILQIYEMNGETMNLIPLKKMQGSKSSIETDGFVWSPLSNHLAYCVCGKKGKNFNPFINIISIPNGELIKTKVMSNMTACQIQWKNELMIASIEEKTLNANNHTVSKYSLVVSYPFDKKMMKIGEYKITNPLFELIECNYANVPSESHLKIDPLMRVIPEPYSKTRIYLSKNNNAFLSVIKYNSHNETIGKTLINVYVLEKETIKVIHTIERYNNTHQVKHIIWSPEGKYFLLGMNDELFELYYVGDEFADNGSIQCIPFATFKHKHATDCQFDYAGQFITTFIASNRSINLGNNTEYKIWNLLGDQIYEKHNMFLSQFKWRPHNTSFSFELNENNLEAVKKHVEKFE